MLIILATQVYVIIEIVKSDLKTFFVTIDYSLVIDRWDHFISPSIGSIAPPSRPIAPASSPFDIVEELCFPWLVFGPVPVGLLYPVEGIESFRHVRYSARFWLSFHFFYNGL